MLTYNPNRQPQWAPLPQKPRVLGHCLKEARSWVWMPPKGPPTGLAGECRLSALWDTISGEGVALFGWGEGFSSEMLPGRTHRDCKGTHFLLHALLYS